MPDSGRPTAAALQAGPGFEARLHVPSALEHDIVGVFGLDNRRPDGGHKRHAVDHTATSAGKRPWFFPSELATAYDFPDGDGDGQTIGLLEFGGGHFADDLAAFGKAAGLASLPTIVPISVDKMPTNTDDEATGEVMLDIEVLAGHLPEGDDPRVVQPVHGEGLGRRAGRRDA